MEFEIFLVDFPVSGNSLETIHAQTATTAIVKYPVIELLGVFWLRDVLAYT